MTTNVPTSYSLEELRLIRELSPEQHRRIVQGMWDYPPHMTYSTIAEDCFIKNRTGPAVEALRRVLRAMQVDGKPFRHTEEFNKLAEFQS